MQGLLDPQNSERFPNVMGTMRVNKVPSPQPCQGQEVDAIFLRLAELGQYDDDDDDDDDDDE